MTGIKGFNKDLACTMGEGIYQYRLGRRETEEKADCAARGFHMVEEPIEVLSWYRGDGSRYCIVEAGGDIHEDGDGRVSCTEITPVREVNIFELGMLECQWLQKHPEREYSRHVYRETGLGGGNDQIVVVRGKHPKAAGPEGAVLFLLKEEPESSRIAEIGVYEVDGERYQPDVFYRADGRRSRT